MTTQSLDNPGETPPDASDDSRRDDGCRRRGSCNVKRRTRLTLAVIALVGVGAAAGALLTAAGNVAAHGFRHHHGSMTLEQVEERAEHKVGWVMEFVDATPEQTERAEEIAGQLVSNLFPLAQQHRDNRQAFVAALAGSQVDRAALEKARDSELALADTASAELVNALADLGEVLSPEQRQKLASFADRMRH